MAITTQLVGKLGGAKWETITIPQTTITGESRYANPKTLASVTVPDGKIFVGYATLNVTSVTPGRFDGYHRAEFVYPQVDSFESTQSTLLNAISAVKVQAMAYSPNQASYTPFSDQVHLGLLGGWDVYKSTPATSTTCSGSLKYMLLDLQ